MPELIQEDSSKGRAERNESECLQDVNDLHVGHTVIQGQEPHIHLGGGFGGVRGKHEGAGLPVLQ